MTEPTAQPTPAPSPTGAEGAGVPLNQAVRQVITVHLSNIPLLNGLAPHVLQQVGAAMQFRTVEKGAYVMHKGSPGDHLVFLLSGRVQVLDVTEDGREIVLSSLSPGDYVGEMAVIDGQPRSASVQAADTSLVAFLPRAHAQQLLYANPLMAHMQIALGAERSEDLDKALAIGGWVNVPAIFVTALVTWLLVIGTTESARFNAVLVRILVGDDAHALDQWVRKDPERAYEPEFFTDFAREVGWRIGG